MKISNLHAVAEDMFSSEVFKNILENRIKKINITEDIYPELQKNIKTRYKAKGFIEMDSFGNSIIHIKRLDNNKFMELIFR